MLSLDANAKPKFIGFTLMSLRTPAIPRRFSLASVRALSPLKSMALLGGAKDVTFMRAVEDGNTDAQATIKTEKQSLRDIPQTFDITTGVDTPEKLKAKWPDGLPTE